MNDKLKPCPFCGGHNIGKEYVETYSLDSSYTTFGCLDCGANFNEGCAVDWNRRTYDTQTEGQDMILIPRKDAEAVARFAFNNAGRGLRAPVATAAGRILDAIHKEKRPIVVEVAWRWSYPGEDKFGEWQGLDTEAERVLFAEMKKTVNQIEIAYSSVRL